MAELPVVVLAFANEQEGRRYLRDLPEELRRLQGILGEAEGNGLCRLELLPNASLDQIFDVFTRNRDRVAILHYAGHADSSRLLLESSTAGGSPAHAEGLATFLGRSRGLQLAFLNGCSTRAQAARLLDAGVASVIATARAIDDRAAREFAVAFYTELASGQALRAAYELAQARVTAARGGEPEAYYRTRHLNVAAAAADGLDPTDDHGFPWEFRPGTELVERWSLPDAAGNPEFGLPELPERDLPESPFRHLAPFTAEHARVFFGRGYPVRELYEQVADPTGPPILLVYGASGVGKSSLLDAGLVPRLEAGGRAVRYRRRDQRGGLAGSLRDAVASADGDGPSTPGEAWHAEEARLGRPLVVFLDQVEEVFTRPEPGRPHELDGFLEAIGPALGHREARPRGKLVLAFRKEWLAEIDRRLAEAKLPRTKVFLRPLDRRGIVEVIRGPARPGPAQRQYRLAIEDGLPEAIAEDLLADAGSALAPTLQVLLTKMWERARWADPDRPRFDRALYESLKAEGYLLEDVLEEGLKGIGRWDADVERSGLALDLLAYHTTDLGTAAQRTRAELEARYAHRAAALDGLLGRCKDHYLIVEAEAHPDAPTRPTRLAHDLLAPLVQRRFRLSLAPGPRARRLLENRAPEWQDGETGPVLDGADLATVEEGASGMRAWTADEARLVEASRRAEELSRAEEEDRTRRLREAEERRRMAEADRQAETERRLKEQERSNRRLRRRAAALAVTLAVAVVAALVAIDRYRGAKRAQDLAQEKTEEATKAAGEANRQTQETKKNLRIADAGRLAALSSAGLLERTASTNDHPILWLLLAVEGIRATRDANEPAVPSAEAALQDALNQVQGRPLPASLGKKLVVTPASDGRIVAGGDDGMVRVWDPRSQTAGSAAFRGHDRPIHQLAFAPDGRLVTADSGGAVRVWDPRNPSAGPIEWRGSGQAPLNLAIAPDGRLAILDAGGTVRVWDPRSPSSQPMTFQALKSGDVSGFELAFAADGRFLTLIGPRLFQTHSIRAWNLEAHPGRPIVLDGLDDQVIASAVAPDGRVAAGGEDGTARVWDLKSPTGKPIEFRGHEGAIRKLAFAPDGRLISGGRDKTVRIWDPKNPSAPGIILGGHMGEIEELALAPGARLVSKSLRTMLVWDLNALSAPPHSYLLSDDGGWVGNLTFTKDGRLVAPGEGNRTCVWNLKDPSDEPVVLRGNEGFVGRFVVTPDDRLITQDDYGHWRMWDLNRPSEQRQRIVLGGDEVIRAIAFAPDGRLVCGDSRSVGVWDIHSPTAPPQVLPDGGSPVAEVIAWNNRVAARYDPGRVRVWDLDRLHSPAIVLGDHLWDIAVAPDGRLAAVGDDKAVRVWDLGNPSARPITLDGSEGPLRAAAFMPDGRLVTLGDDHMVRVWNPKDPLTRPLLLSGLKGISNDPNLGLAVGRDGRHIAASAGSGLVAWDLEDPSSGPMPLRGHTSLIYSLLFTRDGRLISGDSDGIIRIWDLGDRSARSVVLRGHERPVSLLAFAPDGRLVSGSDERKALVWDLNRTEAEPIVLRGHSSSLSALAVLPDGRVVTGSYDGTLRVWDIDLDRLLKLAQEVAGRNLSRSEWRQFFPARDYRRTFPGLPDGLE